MATSSNPFDLAEQELSENPFDIAEKEKSSDDSLSNSFWDQAYDMIFSEKESPFEQGLGSGIRSIGTSIAGLPGDIIKTADIISEKLPQDIPEGIKFPHQKEGLLKNIPGSEELKEKFDVSTEGKYAPSSPLEDLIQETTGDIAGSLIVPGSRILKPIVAALGGNLVKHSLKEAGFEPQASEYGKMGTMMFISMFNPNGARKYASSLYDAANKSVPPGTTMDATNFLSRINEFENKLKKGLKISPEKAPLLPVLEEMRNNVKNGQVPIENLTQLKKDINKVRTEKIYAPEAKGKDVRKGLKKNFGEASHIVDDALKQYGGINSEFLKFYNRANSAWGGIEQSTRASDFIKRHAKGIGFGSGIGSLITAVTSPEILPHIVGGVLVGGGALKSIELLHRIVKNKELQKYYVNVLTEATKENAPAMMRSLKKLDDALSESD